MGRPTKLTRQRINEVANNIYPAGNYFEVACEMAGISATTGYEWLAIGEGRVPNTTKTSTKLFREFSDAVRNSEAKSENAAVIQWRTAFNGDWRAAAEYLSRRFPSRWRKVERQEVTGADNTSVTLRVIYDNKES